MGANFNYLIEEAQNKFFQDASEGIAKNAFLKRLFKKKPSGASAKTTGDELAAAAQKRTSSKDLFKQRSEKELEGIFGKKALAAIREQLNYSSGVRFGHSGKLAMLILESNHNGLQKEAGQLLYDFKSYSDIANGVALSAFWEPLGMTKSALMYLSELDKLDVDNYELANRLLGDSIETDAVIETVMNKVAGDKRPIEDIYAEIMKYAQIGAVPILAKGLSKVRGFGSKLLESVRGKGIKEMVTGPVKRTATEVHGFGREMLGRLRTRRAAATQKTVSSLEKERKALQTQLGQAKPGQAEYLGTRLQSINKRLSHQRQRLAKTQAKLERGRRAAGVVPVMQRPTPKTAPAPKVTPPKSKVTRIEEKLDRNYEQGIGPKPPGYAARKAAREGAKPKVPTTPPKAKETTFAEAPHTEKRVPKTKPPRKENITYNKPPPDKTPTDAIEAAQGEGKAGMLASAKKWQDAGWDALSGVEKRKIYTLLGITFVAQRAIMDKPII